MPDVNGFVEAVGNDVTAVAVPRIDALADGVRDRVLNEYGPRLSAFFSAMVKEFVDEQAGNAQSFVASLIAELSQRYHPEILGALHLHVAPGGLALTGHGVKIDVKRRDGSGVVASLDIPIAIHIKVEDLAVSLKDTTIRLDVVR